MSQENKIRVLIVEDSSLMRSFIQKLLKGDPQIEVIGEAKDPYEARQLLIQHTPDVMLLDIELPKMDGITFLEKVMHFFPVRTLMYSSRTKENSQLILDAVSAGAIDVMEKPATNSAKEMELHARELQLKVKMVAAANLTAHRSLSARNRKAPGQKTPAKRIVAIASSTGGTEALKIVLPHINVKDMAVFLVQHLPPTFMKGFVQHLNQICPFTVKEADHREKVYNGVVYVAPGNFHMEIAKRPGYFSIVLHQKPKLHSIRPSADYLMKSIAKHAAINSIGVVLTGMGKDGAEGLLAMKDAGSFNIAQNEETSIVYGMPKEAVRIGAIDKILSIEEIAEEINLFLKKSIAA